MIILKYGRHAKKKYTIFFGLTKMTNCAYFSWIGGVCFNYYFTSIVNKAYKQRNKET